jgi:putative exosortase-associated protein (TIGR04073 family)
MKKRLIIILILVLPLVLVSGSFAQEKTPKSHKPFTKLKRGMINIGSCPYEIPKQIYLASRKERTLWGKTSRGIAGVFVGSGWMVYRLGAGVYDVLTVPFSDYERPIIEPEYPF